MRYGIVELHSDKSELTIVKTLLNDLWTHIGYEDDGRLVHTDKRTGMTEDQS